MQFILNVQWVMKYLKIMLHVFAGQTDDFDEDSILSQRKQRVPDPTSTRKKKKKTCPNSTVTWWLTAVQMKYLQSTFSFPLESSFKPERF